MPFSRRAAAVARPTAAILTPESARVSSPDSNSRAKKHRTPTLLEKVSQRLSKSSGGSGPGSGSVRMSGGRRPRHPSRSSSRRSFPPPNRSAGDDLFPVEGEFFPPAVPAGKAANRPDRDDRRGVEAHRRRLFRQRGEGGEKFPLFRPGAVFDDGGGGLRVHPGGDEPLREFRSAPIPIRKTRVPPAFASASKGI